jgi:hypothetical protein
VLMIESFSIIIVNYIIVYCRVVNSCEK